MKMIKINTSMRVIGEGKSVYLLVPAEVVREFGIDTQAVYELIAYFEDGKLHLELEHEITAVEDEF